MFPQACTRSLRIYCRKAGYWRFHPKRSRFRRTILLGCCSQHVLTALERSRLNILTLMQINYANLRYMPEKNDRFGYVPPNLSSTVVWDRYVPKVRHD